MSIARKRWIYVASVSLESFLTLFAGSFDKFGVLVQEFCDSFDERTYERISQKLLGIL